MPKEVSALDATVQRLQGLLPNASVEDIYHLANVADEMINESVNHDIQIDRAFASLTLLTTGW